MNKSESDSSVLARIIPALLFIVVAGRVGLLTLVHLLDIYVFHAYQHKPGSFGFVYNLLLFKLHDPATSWFIVFCCLATVLGGFCLIRKRGVFDIGVVIMGAICFTLLLIGYFRGE